jgi:hypothetical protein
MHKAIMATNASKKVTVTIGRSFTMQHTYIGAQRRQHTYLGAHRWPHTYIELKICYAQSPNLLNSGSSKVEWKSINYFVFSCMHTLLLQFLASTSTPFVLSTRGE